MLCPNCQFENPDDAKFCIECANQMEFHCPNCGIITPATGKFCKECGYDLKKPKEEPASINYSEPQSYTPKHLTDKILTTRSSIEGERKLVTVLFADVANYTSMSEKLDPEEVHQIMDGCFTILMDEIHKFEGTVNQFTGDGVMALFGAPLAHEDHAQRACRAALDIQKAMGGYGEKIEKDFNSKFRLRIGLNSGPVIVGAIGDDLRMDYTAIGDTTNLAMRMESMTMPGDIQISENTYRLIKAYFDCEDLGSVPVKGKEEPQRLYKLLKPSEVQTRIEASISKGLVRFVGRKNSMTSIQNAWDKASKGSGQVLGVVGEAGVGKSRLLLEFRSAIGNADFNYLEGHCLHYGGSMAYLPFLDIMKAYFRIEEGQQEYFIDQNIKKNLTALNSELLLDSRPAFQDLLSLKIEEESWLTLEPKIKRDRTFEALRNLFIRLSEEKPLIIAVEDLHWMDKTSEEFISYFIDSMANSPILLILLYRPEYTHQWGSKSYYSKIGLDQLTRESSAYLVSAILEGSEVATELRDLILNRSVGNPLFMEEFTHTLLENGSIERKNNQFVLSRKIDDIQVPETIQGIIAARMDRLEENLKRTMQVASVIGRDFAFRILQTITGMREELNSHLLNLQGLELIYEKSLFPELEYIFKHALIQEVAYNSLLLKRRKEIHKKIGQAIEQIYPERLEEFYEMLAYHYARSTNVGKAMKYLDRANQKAIKLSAMQEAKTYFDEAMALLDTLPETEENQHWRISLLVSQGETFMLLLKFPEYYDLLTRYEPTASGLGDPKLLGAFYGRLGQCEFSFGHSSTIHTLGKAIELCREAGNAEEAGYAYLYLSWSHMDRGDYERVLALKEDVLRMMKQQFNLRIYAYILTAASRSYSYLGQWDSALEEAQKALSVAEEFSDSSLISFITWNLSVAYTMKGDLARAIECAELAVKKAETPADKGWARRALGWALCRAGETKRGIELLTSVLLKFQTGGFTTFIITLRCYLGEGYWITGENANARQTLEESLEVAERCGARYYIGWAERLLGEVTLKTNPTQAAAHFQRSIAVLKEIKAENELALAYVGYGKLHKQQNHIDQAREHLMKALEIFERLGTLIEPDRVREELAGLPKP
jgi:class 3 adenylate cyclase/tetratricopeptide (TPR) repeat protein